MANSKPALTGCGSCGLLVLALIIGGAVISQKYYVPEPETTQLERLQDEVSALENKLASVEKEQQRERREFIRFNCMMYQALVKPTEFREVENPPQGF